MNESNSWIASIVQRVTLPAAVAILLGVASFGAGFVEPVSLSNRKLGLGAVLILAGLLWQAGSEWRFQHESDGWLRSIASIDFGALILWFVMFTGATLLTFRSNIPANPSGPTANALTLSSSSDELCELLIGQRLHEVTDLWTYRYAVVVLCQSAQVSPQDRSIRQGEIVVTVSAANGQPPVSEAGLLRTKDQLQVTFDVVVNQQGWSERYPKRTLQVIP